MRYVRKINAIFSSKAICKLQVVKRPIVKIGDNAQPVCFSVIRNIVLFLFVLPFNQVTWAQDTVAFYFSAHEDDWQLFMNPNAYNDVHKSSTKVVFVYMTAGDAGA